MLDVLNSFREELQLTTTADRLAVTKDRTKSQLQSETASITIDGIMQNGSLVEVAIHIENKTGHKFPTGFPSRRAWIHFAVTDKQGQLIFESGRLLKGGAVAELEADMDALAYEAHHKVIRSAEQVQVYEVVMQDLEGGVTYTLLEAADRIKDNRLLPLGFDEKRASRDVDVRGKAREDDDFQAGSDSITYLVDVSQASPPFTVSAELLYQSVSFCFWRDLVVEEEVGDIDAYAIMKSFDGFNEPVVVSSAKAEFP